MIGRTEITPEAQEFVSKIVERVKISSEWNKAERTTLAHLINRDLEKALSERSRMDQVDADRDDVEVRIEQFKFLIEELWTLPAEELEDNRDVFKDYLI